MIARVGFACRSQGRGGDSASMPLSWKLHALRNSYIQKKRAHPQSHIPDERQCVCVRRLQMDRITHARRHRGVDSVGSHQQIPIVAPNRKRPRHATPARAPHCQQSSSSQKVVAPRTMPANVDRVPVDARLDRNANVLAHRSANWPAFGARASHFECVCVH